MDKKNQEQALDSVTDHVEEVNDLDKNALANALKEVLEEEAKAAKLQAERKKELDAVKVEKQDVQMLVKEFDLAEDQADLILRENGGVVKAAVLSLIKGA